MRISSIGARDIDFICRAWCCLRMYALRPLFGSYGKPFLFDPDGHYAFQNIHVGEDVFLGVRPVLIAALSEVHIGNHVMFGPEVVIKSVLPYDIVAGNIARVVRFRWNVETILAYEEELYLPEQRLSRNDLERWQAEKIMLPPQRALS